MTLNRGGPKQSIIATAFLLLLGNWIRYAGTKARGGIFPVVIVGQVLTGLAQPFCLSAPTRYSDLWFSDHGRTSATALATLANPLGAALGQLVNSAWVASPGDLPNMVLYISIIVSVLLQHKECVSGAYGAPLLATADAAVSQASRQSRPSSFRRSHQHPRAHPRRRRRRRLGPPSGPC